MMSRSQNSSNQPETLKSFRERLWPSIAVWSLSLWFALLMFLAFLPVGFNLALTIAVATAIGVVIAMVLGSPTIRVDVSTAEIHCGRAHIPLKFISGVSALDAEETRSIRGQDYNPAAFVVQRAWIKQGVRFEVSDPSDPTPYWFVSSRIPKALAAAIVRAKATGM